MNSESVASFETRSRIHIALTVGDLARSVEFYGVLFGNPPSKTRPRYAKFEVSEPPVNLSLNEVGGSTGPNNPVAHFGIQVKSIDAIGLFENRLRQAGIGVDMEESVACCYAVQTKIWAVDPDGNKWEVYVVLDEQGAHHHTSAERCCDQDSSSSQATLPSGGSELPQSPVTKDAPRASSICCQ
ncbi:MAG: ArsI/CadI family heavy metal resistance metalloenzyme [Pirellulales bacterium]